MKNNEIQGDPAGRLSCTSVFYGIVYGPLVNQNSRGGRERGEIRAGARSRNLLSARAALMTPVKSPGAKRAKRPGISAAGAAAARGTYISASLQRPVMRPEDISRLDGRAGAARRASWTTDARARATLFLYIAALLREILGPCTHVPG